jgi:hypothetical protein
MARRIGICCSWHNALMTSSISLSKKDLTRAIILIKCAGPTQPCRAEPSQAILRNGRPIDRLVETYPDASMPVGQLNGPNGIGLG